MKPPLRALFRDTGGIRSILLARFDWWTDSYKQISSLPPNPPPLKKTCPTASVPPKRTPYHTSPRSFIDQPRVVCFSSFLVFFIFFFSLSFVCNGNWFIARDGRCSYLRMIHIGILQHIALSSRFVIYAMTNTFDKLPFSPFYNLYTFYIYIYVCELCVPLIPAARPLPTHLLFTGSIYIHSQPPPPPPTDIIILLYILFEMHYL